MERDLLEREIAALGGARYFSGNAALTDSEVKMFASTVRGKTTEQSFLRKEDLKTRQTVDGKRPYILSNRWVDILGENGGWYLVEGDAAYTEKGKENFYPSKLQGWIKKSWVIYKIPAKLDEEPKTGNTKTGEYTCYVEIDLGISDKGYRCYVFDKVEKKYKQSTCSAAAIPDKMTAIYTPKNFKPAAETDLIIYLHGYQDGIPGMVKTGGKIFTPTIQQYLNYAGKPYFSFREIINRLGKNVVFVAPTLGARSQYGKLASHFDSYVEQAVWAINEYVFKARQLSGQLNLRNLIIAAHSGGGAPMLKIAEQTKSDYAKRIRSYWGFDSWYQSSDSWNAVAKNKSVTIYAYYAGTRGFPQEDKKTVFVTNAGKDSNVIIEDGTKHFTLLPYYFEERVSNL